MSEIEFWAPASITSTFLGAAYAAVWIWLAVRLVNRRKRWAIRIAAVLVVGPVLYVLSSGPMTILACRRQVTHAATILPDGTSGVMALTERTFTNWFWIVYAPLLVASEQKWGEPVYSYWELFMNRQVPSQQAE